MFSLDNTIDQSTLPHTRLSAFRARIEHGLHRIEVVDWTHRTGYPPRSYTVFFKPNHARSDLDDIICNDTVFQQVPGLEELPSYTQRIQHLSEDNTLIIRPHRTISRTILNRHTQRYYKALDDPRLHDDQWLEKLSQVQLPDAPTTWDYSQLSPRKKPRVFLSNEQQDIVFLLYQQYKQTASTKLKAYAGSRMPISDIPILRKALNDVDDLKGYIITMNLPLVPYMVNRSKLPPNADYASYTSESEDALSRAVDAFDPSLGYQFSTYACFSIKKAIGKVRAAEIKQYKRTPFSFDADLQRPPHHTRGDPFFADSADALYALEHRCGGLSEKEQIVIARRLGLADSSGTTQTLQEVGDRIGYTKERVRQMQRSGLNKIRTYLQNHVIC